MTLAILSHLPVPVPVSSAIAAPMAEVNRQLLQKIDAGLEFYMKTALLPKPTDPFLQHQWVMCCVHSYVLTGLRRVVELCQLVQPKDYQSYVMYSLLWVDAMHHHHDIEEEFYFPMFGDRLQQTSDKVKAEHDMFHDDLDGLQNYLTSCLPEGTIWGLEDSKKVSRKDSAPALDFEPSKLAQALRKLIEGPLLQHLQDEISYLSPETFRKAGFSAEELAEMFVKTDKYVEEHMNLRGAVYSTLHTPPTLPDFPPVPGFVKSFVVPYILYWTQRKWARFSPIVKYQA